MSGGLVSGSTAKLEAMAGGAVPPGADPSAVAARWLDDPLVGWSCWAVDTLTAALAHACGCRADVVAARRVGPAAAPVDFHSLVVLDDEHGRWVADPYFGVGVISAASGGDRVRPGVWGECHPMANGWAVVVGRADMSRLCRYRTLTGPLLADDVEAFCRISTTHSGVPARPLANRVLDDGIATVRVVDSVPTLRRWRCGPAQYVGVAPTVEVHADWDAAVAALVSLDPRARSGVG